MNKRKAIIVSGYFNPIHKGHIEYFKNSKANGDELFVIVNNDFQRDLKGSKEFQDESERVFIIENLRLVDKCFLSLDKDRTVIETIEKIHTLLLLQMVEIKITTPFLKYQPVNPLGLN